MVTIRLEWGDIILLGVVAAEVAFLWGFMQAAGEDFGKWLVRRLREREGKKL